MKEYHIEKVEQYISVINENFPRFSLSRGQWSDKCLFPSAFRLDDSGMRLFSDGQIDFFLDDFKNESLQYIHGHGLEIQNDYEWLVYAQHFGVPTRLLDFTFSHLVSLMFAVEKAFEEDDEESSVVWLLDCGSLNENSIGNKNIVNLSSESVINNMKYPCAVTARKINPRVIAQNGVFVLFQKESQPLPLEKIDIANDVLRKIIIPHSKAKRILSELYTMGMRFNNLYPELTSVSKDILLKNNVIEFLRMENENE